MSQGTLQVESPPSPPPSTNGAGDSRYWGPREHRTNPIAMARFAMVLFISVEAMTFAGLVSAFLSIRTSLVWPPLDQPRYPVEATAVNTAILLASGLTLYLFRRHWRRENRNITAMTWLLIATVLLGSLFLTAQGIEWVRLVGYGLTVNSSTYGSIFYVIIGFHAVHVLAAVVWLGISTGIAVAEGFSRRAGNLEAAGLFWYFVALVWPILYAVVYF